MFLLIGGEDHRVGQREDTRAPFRALERWAEERFGRPLQVQKLWSGQIIETADGLPYIGKNPYSEHIFVGTGYGGNGITQGTLAAMLISDRILGRSNALEHLFAATRFKPIASAKRIVSENVDYARHLLGDRLKPPELESLAEVPRGSGRIVQLDGRKLAVYRDEAGHLTVMSAACSHLGCIVGWNDTERSWDCPCHGSRFDAQGQVIAGPAAASLKRHWTPHDPPPDSDEPRMVFAPTLERT
jgi:nitrite reductase/ring-hydroxylating ferredoxin subunit